MTVPKLYSINKEVSKNEKEITTKMLL